MEDLEEKFKNLVNDLYTKGPSYPRVDYYEYIMAKALKEIAGLNVEDILKNNEYEHPELRENKETRNEYDPNKDEMINAIFNEDTLSFLSAYAKNKENIELKEDSTPYYFKNDQIDSRVPYCERTDWEINTGDGSEDHEGNDLLEDDGDICSN